MKPKTENFFSDASGSHISKYELYQLETTFNPITEAISVVIKNRRQKSAGSLKRKIPTSTVPTAPMPVQTP